MVPSRHKAFIQAKEINILNLFSTRMKEAISMLIITVPIQMKAEQGRNTIAPGAFLKVIIFSTLSLARSFMGYSRLYSVLHWHPRYQDDIQIAQ